MNNPSAFYAGIDCFIMSSRFEGLSFSVLEALASNLPCILTDVPGNGEFFRYKFSHLWSVRKENPQSIVNAVKKWYTDIVINRKCNHREIIELEFSIENTYKKIIKEYTI